MPRPLAIFDIDGTLFRSSLLIELMDALIEEGIMKPEIRNIYKKSKVDWENREGTYTAYINDVVKALMTSIKGIHYKDLRRVAYKVVARHKGRTYRFTRDLVRSLKAKHYYLLAISHSPKLVVEAFAKTMGFNKVYGIMYETDARGKFTGTMLFEDVIKHKDKVVARALTEGLTLRNSVGVGDTESDIPFLKMVARPICFNPNKELYRAARRHGWRVVVERKDVVYEL